MRIHFGDLPLKTTENLESEGWTRVTGLRSTAARILPWLLGIFLLFALLTPSIMLSFSKAPISPPTDDPNRSASWLAVILSALLAIPAHELVHAAFLPDYGLSQATVLAMWPRKLRFGIFYEGAISRSRWLMMRSAPFILLAVIPAVWLLLTTSSPRSFTVEACMDMLILVNSLGAGADLLAVGWVIFNIPSKSTLLFTGGRAYHKVIPVDKKKVNQSRHIPD